MKFEEAISILAIFGLLITGSYYKSKLNNFKQTAVELHYAEWTTNKEFQWKSNVFYKSVIPYIQLQTNYLTNNNFLVTNCYIVWQSIK